jgi:hypothetical protein
MYNIAQVWHRVTDMLIADSLGSVHTWKVLWKCFVNDLLFGKLDSVGGRPGLLKELIGVAGRDPVNSHKFSTIHKALQPILSKQGSRKRKQRFWPGFAAFLNKTLIDRQQPFVANSRISAAHHFFLVGSARPKSLRQSRKAAASQAPHT